MFASGFGGLTSRWDPDKPVIAAVNGVAMGGGFGLLPRATSLLPAKCSNGPSDPKLVWPAAGVHRLPRQIGLKCYGYMLIGRHVQAQEGYELGFVTAVAQEGEALSEARRWAEMILECSPMSIRATKQAAMMGLDQAGVRAAHEGKYAAVKAMTKSDDYIEGPVAFAEKRPPEWKGR